MFPLKIELFFFIKNKKNKEMWRFNTEEEGFTQAQAEEEAQTQEDLEWAEILRIHEELEKQRIANQQKEETDFERLYDALTLAAKYVEAAKIDYANNPDSEYFTKNLLARLNEYEEAQAEWKKACKE